MYSWLDSLHDIVVSLLLMFIFIMYRCRWLSWNCCVVTVKCLCNEVIEVNGKFTQTDRQIFY